MGNLKEAGKQFKKREMILYLSPTVYHEGTKSNIDEQIEKSKQRLQKRYGYEFRNFQVVEQPMVGMTYQLCINDKLVRKGSYEKERMRGIEEAMRMNFCYIFSRQMLHEYVDALLDECPYLEQEMEYIPPGKLHKIFKKMIREGFSLVDMKQIIEMVCTYYHDFENMDDMIFAIRNEMKEGLRKPYLQLDGKIDVISLLQEEEDAIYVYEVNGEYHSALTKEQKKGLIVQIKEILKITNILNKKPVLIVRRSGVRAVLSKLLHRYQLSVPVFTYHEINELDYEFQGIRHYGSICLNEENEATPEVDKEEKRKMLIDEALKSQDKEKFVQLTSNEWEKYM